MSKFLGFCLVALGFAAPAHAAFVSCTYQQRACDVSGSHYLCSQYGWGNFEFCSATDQTRGPVSAFLGMTKSNAAPESSRFLPSGRYLAANGCRVEVASSVDSVEMSVQQFPNEPALKVVLANSQLMINADRIIGHFEADRVFHELEIVIGPEGSLAHAKVQVRSISSSRIQECSDLHTSEFD